MSRPPRTEAAWDEATLRDPHGDPRKADRVARMFNAIAPSYERFNTVASLGQDARWRKVAVAAARVQPGDVVLDVCCGTGDMLRTFARGQPQPGQLIGVDFAGEMLRRGSYRGINIPVRLIEGDALDLPLAERSVDVVSCAFGVRNFQRLQRGLEEMARVLRPGGRVVILEFATPEHPVLRWGYRVYCDTLLPRVGAWLSRDASGAYRYLPRSIETFETRSSMLGRLRDAGFEGARLRNLTLGGVVVYAAARGG